MNFRNKNYWAVILGGSSGFGMATARKLASEGMNICIVHRDRRGSMKNIQPLFDELSEQVDLITFNCDALDSQTQMETVQKIREHLSPGGGKVRLLLHSIAFGNLKLIAGRHSNLTANTGSGKAAHALAAALNTSESQVQTAINTLFKDGQPAFYSLATEAEYSDQMIEDTDLNNTIYAMGSSMLTWAQLLLENELFGEDARVIGMTSEGNEIAWRGYAAVSAAKATLEAISRSIAVEMAPYGIRSNIVQAGVTNTPALRLIPGNAQISAKAQLRNPFGRLTQTVDVANVIYLLSTDEAAWINGDIIRVDGGEHISG
jgi:NAD(P)-dependent dehydrogenase (short-subunit alcohol dehydrogenase family)